MSVTRSCLQLPSQQRPDSRFLPLFLAGGLFFLSSFWCGQGFFFFFFFFPAVSTSFRGRTRNSGARGVFFFCFFFLGRERGVIEQEFCRARGVARWYKWSLGTVFTSSPDDIVRSYAMPPVRATRGDAVRIRIVRAFVVGGTPCTTPGSMIQNTRDTHVS